MKRIVLIILTTLSTATAYGVPHFVLISAPGSGKGTFSQHLVQNHGYVQVCPGDMFRKEIREQTPLGKQIEPVVAKGDYVDEEITCAIIAHHLEAIVAQNKPFIIDGFPRSDISFNFLCQFLRDKKLIDDTCFVQFMARDEVCLQRIVQRVVCTQCAKVYSAANMLNTCEDCGISLTRRMADSAAVAQGRIAHFHDNVESLMQQAGAMYKTMHINTEHPIADLQRTYDALVAQAPSKWYQSHFVPPNTLALKVLINGQILAPDETPAHMVERVVDAIASVEVTCSELTPHNMLSTDEFAQQLGTLMDECAIVFSTPILTNAGRFTERPLSACAMPPVDLHADLAKIKQVVDQYHQDGMGTGYNLSELDNPVAMLKYLNDIAVAGAHGTKEQRPVGNMAILDVDHPAIADFIMAKVGADARGEDWKFNISVNITDAFMQAVERNEPSATQLFNNMAYAAHQCGDPGLICLERLNKDNPTPELCSYKTTAPCAEVGLAPGETCVFGYINLAKMVTKNASIDFAALKNCVQLLTRGLDNILELSIQRYAFSESKEIMQAKRKIGIGICGFADMLIALNLSYTQAQARDVLQDVLNFISYHSKTASMELAKSRGSFTAIGTSRYMDESFIMNKFGTLDTPHVSREQWAHLARTIKETQCLRHATTTSLPPTGRSALVIAASTGIEPLFSVQNHGDKANGHLYITATEISPSDHLAMAEVASKAIDEAISKTINVPEETTPQEIAQIYKQAYAAGLKGMSVFRNNSRTYQPKALTKHHE